MTSGILRGIEEGWFMGEIADAAFQYQLGAGEGRQEGRRGQLHTESVSHELEILRVSHEVEREQVPALADRKAARDERRGRGGRGPAGRGGADARRT